MTTPGARLSVRGHPTLRRAAIRISCAALGLAGATACSSGGAGGSGGGTGGGTGGAATASSASSTASSSSAGGGTTGSGSSGGAGGSGACTPGEMRPCYTGPAGTEGVGICHGGMEACNASGVGYGSCLGEVLPKPESCSTPEDDDCNGVANDGCVCTPNAQSSCYDGPAGTEGVGTCVAGQHTCDFQGTSYGPCLGEVTPQVEDCATHVDENCDGATPPCTGAYVFGEAFGGALDEEGLAVTADPSGNAIVAGYSTSTVDFGCGPLAGGATQGALVVELTPAGACLWSKRFGDGSVVTGVAADGAGNVCVTGTFSGTVDFGGNMLTSAGSTDVFFAKLDPTGAVLWANRFGDAAAQTATGIAVDPANNIVATGYFQGSIDFGAGALVSQGGNDVYLVKLDQGGTVVWSKSFGDAGNQLGKGVAADIAYDVLITGSMTGTTDFGGGPLTSAGLGDVFVASFDTSGNHLWSKIFGDVKDQSGNAIAVHGSDEVVVAGEFDGTLALGGATYTTIGGEDAFLLALDGSGNYVWSRQVGGANTQVGSAVALDVFGNVAFGGVLTGTADLGGGALTSAGLSDVFVAKYDPTGAYLWGYRFGDPATQTLEALAFDPSGNLMLAGILNGPTDFGGGPVIGGGGEDLFVAKLAP